jgi:hypothetical protein
MMACAGLLTHLESEEESDESGRPYASAPHLTYWAPVSRVTARSRGQGLPTTHWQLSQDTVQNHAGHREDYLYYRVPLRGDFEIECEVTSFDFRDTQLLCAGNWVAPSYELKSYTVGDLRQRLRVGELSPPMSLVDRWMRHRTVVRDGACTTWLNGRRIHEQPLEAAHDPWLAVRSTWITTGAVRSVRVTGTPQIPGAINLASLPELSGWSSYYERSVGGGDSEGLTSALLVASSDVCSRHCGDRVWNVCCITIVRCSKMERSSMTFSIAKVRREPPLSARRPTRRPRAICDWPDVEKRSTACSPKTIHLSTDWYTKKKLAKKNCCRMESG